MRRASALRFLNENCDPVALPEGALITVFSILFYSLFFFSLLFPKSLLLSFLNVMVKLVYVYQRSFN